MYNMDPERPPSRPVVVSSVSASQEFAIWVRENKFEMLADGSGLVWRVQLEVNPTPNPDDLRTATWGIAIHVTAEPDAMDFLRTQTLDALSESDQRLADLLEKQRVPLRLRPIKSEAPGPEGLRVFLADTLPKLRAHLATQTFHDLKRQRIAAVVREWTVFGGRP